MRNECARSPALGPCRCLKLSPRKPAAKWASSARKRASSVPRSACCGRRCRRRPPKRAVSQRAPRSDVPRLRAEGAVLLSTNNQDAGLARLEAAALVELALGEDRQETAFRLVCVLLGL